MAEKREYVAKKIEWPVKVEINRGLQGAITNETKVGFVDGQKGWLVYRGHNIFDLAEHSTFEETTWLLLKGKLPTKAELGGFSKKLAAARPVPGEVFEVLKKLPKTAHPMSVLRPGISALGCFDPKAEPLEVATADETAIKIIAQTMTVGAAAARVRAGQEPLAPDPSLSHAADYLRMTTGEKPSASDVRIMDVSLILHADHGMNASTFTSMVVASSLSDLYSVIAAGIGSLKGPLHGGANVEVLKTLAEIGTADKVEEWYKKARAEKRLVMGFGHRVYKAYDPRAKIFLPLAEKLAEKEQMTETFKTMVKLEEVVIRELGKEKGIFPNVDFYSGVIFKGLGFDPSLFTIIFSVGRVSGWLARVLEYLPQNRIFRPRAVYVGEDDVKYVPIEKR